MLRYQKRISGPLLDRIDIHLDVPRVHYEKLAGDRLGEPSAMIQARVERARAFYHISKLARMIADLADCVKIEAPHLAEAIQYRPRWVA